MAPITTGGSSAAAKAGKAALSAQVMKEANPNLTAKAPDAPRIFGARCAGADIDYSAPARMINESAEISNQRGCSFLRIAACCALSSNP